MDYPTIFSLVFFLFAFKYALTISRHRNSRLPPGPYPFPIIGDLLKLGDKPHHSLATLAKRYGPLMLLKLGSKTTIVISSPQVAKEFFHTHDISISSRSISAIVGIADHHKYSVVWLPVGDQWRKIQRITKEYLLSVQCLDANEHLRREKVQELLEHVHRCCINGKAMNVGEAAFTTSLNILSNYIFSIDFAQYDSEFSQEFKEAVMALMELGGKPNLADFFPILKRLDLQGIEREGNAYIKKLLIIFDRIIDQRLQSQSSSSSYDGVSTTNVDVLDKLLNLNLKDESQFSRDDMRHLFFDLFTAGTDTTSCTLEWAMAELIRNPEKMKTARLEIMKLMQNNNKNIQEKNISELPYLQAVIKETFRLHPPGALLLPREAIHDVEVQGFIVPKNAQILCNVWAMGRDPNIWSDPETFIPERFLDVKIDYKGQNYELIPFGAGRRICPGLNFAQRMLHIMLGSLIYKFDWKLDENIGAKYMDMEEKFGFTLPKKVPLIAIPIKL